MGAINGGAAHSVYSLFEHLWGLKNGTCKPNSAGKSELELAVEKFVYDVVEDNSIDGDDSPKLSAFLEMVK
jgi:hypothetical protein